MLATCDNGLLPPPPPVPKSQIDLQFVPHIEQEMKSQSQWGILPPPKKQKQKNIATTLTGLSRTCIQFKKNQNTSHYLVNLLGLNR